jgi:hypothetical protein
VYETKIIFHKEGETPFETSSMLLGFAKKGSELVKEYPELAKKIANKEKGYGVTKLEEIVAEYNDWYANQEFISE